MSFYGDVRPRFMKAYGYIDLMMTQRSRLKRGYFAHCGQLERATEFARNYLSCY
jgi:hypothetical protein